MVKTSPFNAEGVGSIPVQGAQIPHASLPKHQNIKPKQYYNKFNKEFKIMVCIQFFFFLEKALILNSVSWPQRGHSGGAPFFSLGLCFLITRITGDAVIQRM